MIILFSFTSIAAEISGMVYQFDFETANNSIVVINTIPKQTIVAKEGSYKFNVPEGNYTLTAYLYDNGILDSSVSENISIIAEGSFVLDLILFPEFGELDLFDELEELDELGYNVSAMDNNQSNVYIYQKKMPIDYYLLSVIIAVIIIIFLILNSKKSTEKMKRRSLIRLRKESLPDISSEIIEFIKSENGRTTQKEIRKNIPSSEAKISLVLSELEHKNKIERIKKGRSNIIILKK